MKKRGRVLKHKLGTILRNERNGETQKECRYTVNNKENRLIHFGTTGRNNEM
jgi:hypothetical protein